MLRSKFINFFTSLQRNFLNKIPARVQFLGYNELVFETQVLGCSDWDTRNFFEILVNHAVYLHMNPKQHTCKRLLVKKNKDS